MPALYSMCLEIMNSKRVVGIDEAGRGPVVGPMVVAAVALKEEDLSLLLKLNVKDSKKLLPKTREKLFYKIIENVEKTIIIIVNPPTIDYYVNSRESLTELEANVFSQAINELKPDIIYIDAASTDSRKFQRRIENKLKQANVKIICEHKADEKYLPVSAASIIAKVMRDSLISSIKRFLGELGSGYPSDPITKNFIKNLEIVAKNKNFFRISWKTIKEPISSQNILKYTST